MKAIFIYSRLSGTSFIIHRISYIKKKLQEKFDDLTLIETKNYDELKKYCLLACKKYDYLIFSGGDGAVNSIINIIAEEPKKPILGYIPAGTLNDFARNFRLNKNINKALKVILRGAPAPFDILKINNQYAAYVAACGAFSDIPYKAKQSSKRKFGFLSYYIMAVRDVFIPQKVVGILKCNGKEYSVHTPFLLVLNGNHVGGFYVNLRNKINDGKFNIFITRPGVFNGLLHYLFFKTRTVKILTNHFTFTFNDKPNAWCLDGEMADLKNIEVWCCPSHLKIMAPIRLAKKLYRQQEVAIENHED